MTVVTISKLARGFEVSPEAVRRAFKKWCELNRDFPENYIVEGKDEWGHPYRRYEIPEEAVEWIKNYLELSKLKSKRCGGVIKAKMGIVTIKDLSKEFNVNQNFIRREFRWWCYERGIDPSRYLVGGVGYALPKEFLRHIKPIIQRHLAEKRVIKLSGVSKVW